MYFKNVTSITKADKRVSAKANDHLFITRIAIMPQNRKKRQTVRVTYRR